MAKIKRIVTSEVEGRNLSDFYGDNSYSFDGDGTINYYGENKMGPVLEPGVIYGSNADSGDGYGYNTIKLVPHAPEGYINDDRYLIIDPTAPNHIHIRAGGVQDASNAELILGAEKANVKITDYNHSVVINTHDSSTEQQKAWVFDNLGNLTAYQDATIGVATAPGNLNLSAYGNIVFQYSGGEGQDSHGVFVQDKNDPNNRVATIGDLSNVFPSPVAWTPLLSAIGFAQTSNPATGEYMKYGRMVVANLNVPFSNVTNFGTGQYSINLPFPVAKHTDVFGGTLHDTDTNSFYTIKGHANAGESTMTLWHLSIVTKDAEFDSNSPFVLDTTDLFHMNFIYETTV